jgi:hypothetical protein
MSAEKVVREFPIRSCYFTPMEVQNIVDLMDSYLLMSLSTMPDDTEIKHINELIWDTMKHAYTSMIEER